ncbi:YifB family Mg chelatase-like AAA ATPase [Candidatus Parcubacteria bacterium]|nr:YifB family Mg chelatase-like AAA ATPase [Candidatus Parcubacteria bacterium]
MPVRLTSAAVVGLRAEPIDVELDAVAGLHVFHLVGLADKAVGESRERIAAAIRNSGAQPPDRLNLKVTVNLAPADLKKEGAAYDLAIAAAFLAASDQLRPQHALEHMLFVGELALDGAVRPVNGVLAVSQMAKARGFSELFVPAGNAREAALVSGLNVRPVSNLLSLIAHLEGTAEIAPQPQTSPQPIAGGTTIDLADIRGQESAKRALEIAAAGGHNLLLTGPPGTGKTLLAKALAGILPELTAEEVLETTTIASVAGVLDPGAGVVQTRPFRSPHHTASEAALIGGGTNPKPGEISLAHRGVLFLDELAEFPRHVLETLRQPIEEGTMTVSRSQGRATFPARFTLVAAMNPCPCGNLTHPSLACTCPPAAVARYRRKLSGPLLDRIDLVADVPPVDIAQLGDEPSAPLSQSVRTRITAARTFGSERNRAFGVSLNSELPFAKLRAAASLEAPAEAFVRQAAVKLSLSARAYHRLLKVSRTIADLEAAERVKERHVSEALQYRIRVE